MRGLRGLKERMDPRRLNGGPFLGLNGIAIKSHGGTDAFGFASAIEVGYDMAESDVLERLAADLEALHGKLGRGRGRAGATWPDGDGPRERRGRGETWHSFDP